ncbi:ADP-ribosylglycohydrolase family protein [Haloimpatiens lingqiaonensis]|uniref:ADP-ribosylglycohydrolase family protein n=1 Tax=Haloimpatiens lingqiaonensis TaxID=1380675 RepID=UPI0010FF08B8|nr:ADP-ribosylglycohydrolase family protein [Haloimpatiens lingqiaonensis]
MIGAIAGDIIGSIFERKNIKTKEFQLFSKGSIFTDDTVLTIATMDSILNSKPFSESYKKWFRKYPNAGFGGNFYRWGFSESMEPYNSWGNGSAMRVSPIGYIGDSMGEVMAKAKESAEVTHNHVEGIKGAQAIAASIYLAKIGKDKDEIRKFVEDTFDYDLSESLYSIRKWYAFDVSCEGSVPQAIRAFLESKDYEDAIRNAVSIGGDSDTIACMTGGIAEAYYKEIPRYIISEVFKIIPEEMVTIIDKFYNSATPGIQKVL